MFPGLVPNSCGTSMPSNPEQSLQNMYSQSLPKQKSDNFPRPNNKFVTQFQAQYLNSFGLSPMPPMVPCQNGENLSIKIKKEHDQSNLPWNYSLSLEEMKPSLFPRGKPVVFPNQPHLLGPTPNNNTQSTSPDVIMVSSENCPNLDDSSTDEDAKITPRKKSSEPKCDICGVVANVTCMKKIVHLRCSDCVRLFPKQINNLYSKSPTKHEKVHKCEICDKMFVSVATLKTHQRVHTGEKPYECTFCHKTFLYEGNMKTHMRIHTGEKPFSCEVCGKCFSQSGTLKKHLRMHSGEKPYQCEFCDKTFTYSENLIPHRRTHSGEKPFHCEICDKSFTQPGSMKNHRKKAHGDNSTEANRKRSVTIVKEHRNDGGENLSLVSHMDMLEKKHPQDYSLMTHMGHVNRIETDQSRDPSTCSMLPHIDMLGQKQTKDCSIVSPINHSNIMRQDESTDHSIVSDINMMKREHLG